MRLILAAAFAVLAACSEKPPEPATTPPVSDPTAIIAADRAFAAEAAKTGWVEASEQWSEPDAIVLGATAPESARQFYAAIDPANRKDTSLRWAPEFAGVSVASDFGFTTGPFNGDGAAFGYYLTVWRQQPAGEWRWIYNGGVDTATPTTIDPAFDVALIDPPTGGEGAADIARTTLAVLEAGLAISTSNDAPLALGAQFAANAQMYRQNAAPFIGEEAITKALETGPRAIAFRQLQSHASAAGDLVFTLGEARWQDDAGVDGSGLYGRIWSYTADGWRIVFDQIVPRDLPAAALQ
jgi:ketosteroid isomerase-like protein